LVHASMAATRERRARKCSSRAGEKRKVFVPHCYVKGNVSGASTFGTVHGNVRCRRSSVDKSSAVANREEVVTFVAKKFGVLV
jgi:hypothetical protein